MRRMFVMLVIAACAAVAGIPQTPADDARPFGSGDGSYRPAQAGRSAVTFRSGPGTGEKRAGRFWEPPVFISDEALNGFDADCDDETGVIWLVLAPAEDSLIRFYNSTDHGLSWTYVYYVAFTPNSTYRPVHLVVGAGDSNYVHAFVRHSAAMGDLYDIRLKQDLSYSDFHPVLVGPDTVSLFDVCRDNWPDYGLFVLTANPFEPGNSSLFLRSFDFGRTWDQQVGNNIQRPALCAGVENYLHFACAGFDDRGLYYFHNYGRGDPTSWGGRTGLGTDTMFIYDPKVSVTMKMPESLATVWVMYSHSNGFNLDFDADYAVRRDSWGGTWIKHQQMAATPASEMVGDAECYRERGNAYMDVAFVAYDTAGPDSAALYTWVNADAPRGWSAPIKVSDTLKVGSPRPEIVFSPGATPYNVPGIVFGQYDHAGTWFNATWFGTGAAEPGQLPGRKSAAGATIVRGVLWLEGRGQRSGDRAELLDIAGRKVLDLAPGANDLSPLPPGVYFCRRMAELESRGEPSAVNRLRPAVTKVVVAR